MRGTLWRMRSVCMILVVSGISAGETLQAAIPVVDAANLTRNTITSMQMVQDVIHQAEQIQNQLRQYDAQLQALERFDTSSYDNIQRVMAKNRYEVSRLLQDLETVSFNLERIDGQYSEIFPEDGAWSAEDSERYRHYSHQWNEELRASSRKAMEAQSVLSRTEEYNAEVAEILQRSEAADGDVRQLQAQNQMLGVMSAQLSDLTTTIAASERAHATRMAISAEEREAERRLHEEMLFQYGVVDDQPEPLYHTMPSIKK